MILSSLYQNCCEKVWGIGICCGSKKWSLGPEDDFERLVQSVTVGFVAWPIRHKTLSPTWLLWKMAGYLKGNDPIGRTHFSLNHEYGKKGSWAYFKVCLSNHQCPLVWP